MSANTVIIRYDSLLERWEIGYEWAVGRTELTELTPEVRVGRSVSGSLVEMVVDAAEVPPAALVHVSAAFGPDVADLVRSLAGRGDVDETVDVADASPVAAVGTTVLVGEAGVPVPLGDDVYRVEPDVAPELLGLGTDVERVDITIQRHDTELVVRVRGVDGEREVWVRVSDGDTGSLLATTRLRPSSVRVPQGGAADDVSVTAADDPGLVGAVTFALEREPTTLHVGLTDDPLHRIPPRNDRRTVWCDQLLTEARSSVWRRPAAAAQSAAAAVPIATALGDADRLATAHGLARRARFVRRSRWAGLGVLVVALLLLLGRCVTDDADAAPGSGPATLATTDATDADGGERAGVAPDGAATTVPSTTTASVPTSPAFAPVERTVGTTGPDAIGSAAGGEDGETVAYGGPARYVIDEFEDVVVTRFGSAVVDRSRTAEIELTMVHTVPGQWLFGTNGIPNDDFRAIIAARSNCESMVRGIAAEHISGDPRLDASTYVVRAVPLPTPPTRERNVVLAQIEFTGLRASGATVRSECERGVLSEEGMWVTARQTRDPLEVTIPIDGLEPGYWSLELERVGGGTTDAEAPITLLIRD